MLIQKLRLQRGWSQEQLAELSGVSVRTIQRIEGGQTASVETLKALGSVFEVDFSELRDTPMTPDVAPNLRQDEVLALAHVRKVKSFYLHLAQYVTVILFLGVVNLMTSPQYLWFVWPALGWGIGIVAHGVQVFSAVPFLNGDWERRQVEKYLGRKI
jgi:transcriptional regulator with XRE-family HTH domain